MNNQRRTNPFCLPELSYMPINVKKNICGWTDTMGKLSLRLVSQDIQRAVDQTPIHYTGLKLTMSCHTIKCCWLRTRKDMVEQTFKPKGDDFEVTREPPYPVKMGYGDYRRAAARKLLSVLKNPNISVGELILEVDSEYRKYFAGRERRGAPKRRQPVPEHIYPKFQEDKSVIFEEFREFLSTNYFQAAVEQLEIKFQVDQDNVMSVLPYLQPKTLKVLNIYVRWTGSDASWELPSDRIVETDQWRQMKEVHIGKLHFDAPLETWSHLNCATLEIPADSSLRQILETFLQKPTLDSVLLQTSQGDFNLRDAHIYLNGFEKQPNSDRYSNKLFIKLPQGTVSIVMDPKLVDIRKL